MSWLDLNYMSTFILESSVEGPVVPDSYDGRGNDDHTEEVVSSFCFHHKEALLPDLNECLGCGLLCLAVPFMDKKTMAITFSLVMPHAYNKTLVSLFTPKNH
ncbi:hypothetical protein Hanom_Chr00s000190g01627811 [Helianthus anomalus]